MDKYIVIIKYIDGEVKRLNSNVMPERINQGVLKVEDVFINLLNVERYLVEVNLASNKEKTTNQ